MEFLIRQFNMNLDSQKMSEEWRKSVLVPMLKNKVDEPHDKDLGDSSGDEARVKVDAKKENSNKRYVKPLPAN